MTVQTALRTPALLCAIVLGVLADALVRVPGRPGVNVALWAAAGTVVLVVLLQRRSDPVSREARWLVAGAFGFACTLMLRDAEALAAFSLFGAVALLLLAAGRYASAWATRAHVSDIAFAVLRVGVLCAAGPLGWGRGVPDPATGTSVWARHGRTFARGTALATPALLVLAALLMSADPVFSRIVHNAFHIDIQPLVEHLVFAAAMAWLTAGFLRAFMIADDIIAGSVRVPQPAIAAAEISVAMWILNLLFIGFMIVQLRYLFGGADLVEVTAGLSYAEYARRGFFELVATAALVLPILLLADWAAAPDTSRSRIVFRATSLVLVALLIGVIASAAYRMKLYQSAYGLTEDRLYVSVFIVWLATVLGWLVLTVLRGHRQRFTFGAIIAGLVCIVALHILNPHALIARINISRAASGAAYDGRYLGTLSADAVPAIIAGIDSLPEAERCTVNRMLVKRWSGPRAGGWRTWNLSDARARRLVAQLPRGMNACTFTLTRS